MVKFKIIKFTFNKKSYYKYNVMYKKLLFWKYKKDYYPTGNPNYNLVFEPKLYRTRKKAIKSIFKIMKNNFSEKPFQIIDIIKIK